MADFKLLDSLQQAVIEEKQKKQDKGSSKYHFDKLSLFFGEEYEVGGIKISQPTIGDILTVREENFYRALSPILYNSTSIRLMLWEMNIDWCKIKDIEVFSFLSNLLKQDNELLEIFKKSLNLLFKETDMLDFELLKARRTEDSDYEFCLRSENQGIILFEEEYMELAEYVRTMLNFHPKVERSKRKAVRKSMIDEERMNAANKDNKDTSQLLSLVSACINHPGFKYKLQELRDMGIYQFMDSVQRLQIYESSNALLHGSYSGFCDTSKIDKNEFNFMREI